MFERIKRFIIESEGFLTKKNHIVCFAEIHAFFIMFFSSFLGLHYGIPKLPFYILGVALGSEIPNSQILGSSGQDVDVGDHLRDLRDEIAYGFSGWMFGLLLFKLLQFLL